MDTLRSEDAPPLPVRPAFAIVGPRRGWVSPAIVAINVLVFVVMLARGVSLMSPTIGDLRKFGANDGPMVAEGEWFRLVTSAFVHVGLLHIALNMWVFRSLGPAAERLFGNAAFALIYLASAIGGSLASVLWNPSVVSAGASGAIFGVAGAFLAFFLGHRQAMPPALFRSMMRSMVSFVLLNTMFGLMVPGVDNAAHLGGLFTGFVAGFLLNRDIELPPVLGLRRLVRATLLFGALIALASLVPWRARTDSVTGSHVYFDRARRALANDEFDAVVNVANEWIAERPDDPEAWELRGVGRLGLGDDRDARADLDHALSLDRELPYALSHRAYMRLEEGDVAGALSDYDAFVDLRPADAFGFLARAHARYSAKDWAGALRDFQTVVGLEPAKAGKAHLYVWILRSRLSMQKDAIEELRQASAGPHATGWDAEMRGIAAFVLGQISEEELRPTLLRSRRTAARYYVGMKFLFDGDLENARKRFEACANYGARDAYETMHAKTELELLSQ